MADKVLWWAAIICGVLALWSLVGIFRGGLLGRLQALVGTVIWGAAGLLLGAILVILHTFSAFTGETLVAVVETRRLGPDRFELTYSPSANGETAETLELQGDQWAISGGIVKWHPWLTSLGLSTYHKPLRLTGQYVSPERQRARPPSVYLLDEQVDRFWEMLYWAEQKLPIVDAVYGSSAYVYAEPNMIAEIYITPIGYLIRRSPRAVR